MTESVDWLSPKLPFVTFDIDQGGNVRKGDEADAAYKLICIAIVISDYKESIVNYFTNYDFTVMDVIDGRNSKTMKQALEEFQSLNSVRINSIISSAAIRISEYKEKKNEFYYTSLLSREETLELSTLSLRERLPVLM